MKEVDKQFRTYQDTYSLPRDLSEKELEAKMKRIGTVIKERAEVAIERKAKMAEYKEKEEALEEELEDLAFQLGSKTEIVDVECEWQIVDEEKRTAKLVRLDTKETVVKTKVLPQWEFEELAQETLPGFKDRKSAEKAKGKLDEAQPG